MVLKGHGFIRADKTNEMSRLLAAEGWSFFKFVPILALFRSLLSRAVIRPSL
jgi:hypothetical protein